MKKTLYIFDLDGTLIEGHVERDGDSGPFTQVRPFLDVERIPGRFDRLERLMKDPDVTMAIATNKAGVAFGHQSITDCKKKRQLVIDAFALRPFWVTPQGMPRRFYWFEAYGHPNAPDEWGYRYDDFDRKPNPGMLLKALVRTETAPAQALMVGDMDADKGAAEAAGIDFLWASEFFKDRSGDDD